MRDETSSGRLEGPGRRGPRWWRNGRGPLTLAALALAAAAGVPALAAHDARASAPTAGEAPDAHEVATCEGERFGLTAAEYESLKLHNEARAGAGLGHLCVNPTLTEAARAHAKDMIERKYFSHDNPDGEDPIARMEEAGYADWSSWGENIGWGSGEQADAREVFADLMNSPGHRENILKDGFLEVGIGAVAGEYEGQDDAGMYAMGFGSRNGQEHEPPEPAPAAQAPPGEPAPEPAPEGTTPEETTPEETTAPQPPAPEEAPPEGTTPESTTPESTTPEETVPESTTPESTAPEETAPEETPPADEPPDEGEVTPPDQEEPLEETPEPGESDEEEQREVAGAQQAICETFGEIREREIAEHRAKAEGASQEEEGEETEGEAGGGDLASRIIADTHQKIADQFEKSFLNPSFCGSGGEPEALGEGVTPEGTPEEVTGGEGDRTVTQTQKQVQNQSNHGDSDDGEETQPGGETTPEGTVPEETTPEETTPEQTTPEGTTPESTTPEGTSGGPAGG